MNKTTQFFIGIDVSKPYFDATFLRVINPLEQPIKKILAEIRI